MKRKLLLGLVLVALASCGTPTSEQKNSETVSETPIESVAESVAESPIESVEESAEAPSPSEARVNIVKISVESETMSGKTNTPINLNVASATSSLHGDISSNIEVKITVASEEKLGWTKQSELTAYTPDVVGEYVLTYKVVDEDVEKTCTVTLKVEENYEINIDGKLDDTNYEISYKTGIDKNVTVKVHASNSGIYFGVEILDKNLIVKSRTTNLGSFDASDCFDIFLNPKNSSSTDDLIRIRMTTYDYPNGLITAMPNVSGEFKADLSKFGNFPVKQKLGLIGNSTISQDGGTAETTGDEDVGVIFEFYYSWDKLNVNEKPSTMGIAFAHWDTFVPNGNVDNGTKRAFVPLSGTGNFIGTNVEEYGIMTLSGEGVGIVWAKNDEKPEIIETNAELTLTDGYNVDFANSATQLSPDTLAILDQTLTGDFEFVFKIDNSSINQGLKNDGTKRGLNLVFERNDQKYDVVRLDLTVATKGTHILNVHIGYAEAVTDLSKLDDVDFKLNETGFKFAVGDPVGRITVNRVAGDGSVTYSVNVGQPGNESQIDPFTFASAYTGSVKIGFATDRVYSTKTILVINSLTPAE